MPNVGLGIQTVTQTATITSTSIIDLDIPSGTAVISSGIQVAGFGNALMTADGPHPTDDTKWRFQASVAEQSGGNGYSVSVTCWMIVANDTGY
jgi:hypothetical protein